MTHQVPPSPGHATEPGSLDFNLSADEIALLLAGSQEDDDDDDLLLEEHAEVLFEPSVELHRVAQNISGQYSDILYQYASAVLSGRATMDSSEQVLAAVDALERLAGASDNKRQTTLLSELRTIVADLESVHKHKKSNQRQLSHLQNWIPKFADTLEESVGQKLRSVVVWQGGSLPLLEELRGVRGIGPRRLARLYSAGLFKVEVVATADPIDIAEVTGLPKALAEQVVQESCAFARRERSRCLAQMHRCASRLNHILHTVPMEQDAEALNSATQTLSQLNTVIELLHGRGEL